MSTLCVTIETEWQNFYILFCKLRYRYTGYCQTHLCLECRLSDYSGPQIFTDKRFYRWKLYSGESTGVSNLRQGHQTGIFKVVYCVLHGKQREELLLLTVVCTTTSPTGCHEDNLFLSLWLCRELQDKIFTVEKNRQYMSDKIAF